eukprot:168974_1
MMSLSIRLLVILYLSIATVSSMCLEGNLKNKASGLCLTTTNSTSGTVEMTECDSLTTAHWTFDNTTNYISSNSTNYFRLKNIISNKCLANKGGGRNTVFGGLLNEYECDSIHKSYLWFYSIPYNEWFHFRSKNGDWCLWYSATAMTLNVGGICHSHDCSAESPPGCWEFICLTQVPTAVTQSPTAAPSATTIAPTAAPSQAPTMCADFEWIYPNDNAYIINDAFSRIQFNAQMNMKDGIDRDCDDCFMWKIIDYDGDQQWIAVNDLYKEQVVFYNELISDDTLSVSLIVKSIRTKHVGYCYDVDHHHIFETGHSYGVRVEVKESLCLHPPINVTMNNLPSDGFCSIMNMNAIGPLDTFHVHCSGWSDIEDANLTYNVLIADVPLSTPFVQNVEHLSMIMGSGDIFITALIKDSNNAVSCYEIIESIELPSSDLNCTQIMNRMETLLDDAYNSNTFVVATHSVVYDLYSTQCTSNAEAVHFTSKLILNVIDAFSAEINQTDATLNDILSSIATLSELTSIPQFIDTATITQILQYLPILFDTAETVDPSHEMDGNVQDILQAMSSQAQELINNLEISLIQGDNNATNTTTMFADLNDYSTCVASIALSQSLPGESYFYTTSDNAKTISSTKLNTDPQNRNDQYPFGCSTQTDHVLLPTSLVTDSNTFDCAVSSSSHNHFSHSNAVTVNLYNTDQARDCGHKPSLEAISSPCDPYLIIILVENASVVTNKFPDCVFWNESTSNWENNGCYVYDTVPNQSVTCACIHLTTFQVTARDFIPRAHIITEWHLRELTVYNLTRYPTVWMTICGTLFISILLCIGKLRNRENRSIIAYEDVIYKSVRDAKIGRDKVGQEIKIIKQLPNKHKLGQGLNIIAPDTVSKKSLCTVHWRLFKVYIRNDHTVLAVFQRSAGTNYSIRQRIGCFFMYLCTIMAITAAFYGIKQDKYADISASFIISLISTLPVFMVKKIFEKSKPQKIPSARARHRHSYQSIHSFDLEEVEVAETTTTHTNSKKMTIGDVNNIKLNLDRLKSTTNTRVIQLAHDIRDIIYDETYALPSKCNQCAWLMIGTWTVAACGVAILYGLQFDILFNAKNTQTYALEQDMDCNHTRLQSVMDAQFINNAIKRKEAQLLDRSSKSDYNVGDSASWLISLGQSLLLSMFVWQPINIYLLTWLKIWAFSYHLKLQIGATNILKLVRRCCGCGCGDDAEDGEKRNKLNHLTKQLTLAQRGDLDYEEEEEGGDPTETDKIINKHSNFMAHNNRPLDMIGFLTNDDLFVDDTDKKHVKDVELAAIDESIDDK